MAKSAPCKADLFAYEANHIVDYVNHLPQYAFIKSNNVNIVL